AEFGFVPPQTVTNLLCKTVWIGDSRISWFILNFDGRTFTQITNQHFMTFDGWDLPATVESALSSGKANAPKWWNTSSGVSNATVYYKEGLNTNYARSYALVWLDKNSGAMYAKAGAWQ